MELYLVQHGESATSERDPSRPLTEAGMEVVRKMAVFAARLGVRVDEIRHSGKLRARQTAEIFAEPLEPPNGVNATMGINPVDDVQPVADLLQREGGCLMLVGHLPFLGRMVGLLVAGDPEVPVVVFRNAGIVRLVRENRTGGRWSVDWVVTPDFVP